MEWPWIGPRVVALVPLADGGQVPRGGRPAALAGFAPARSPPPPAAGSAPNKGAARPFALV